MSDARERSIAERESMNDFQFFVLIMAVALGLVYAIPTLLLWLSQFFF